VQPASSPDTPPAGARKRSWRALTAWQRARERVIEFALMCCGLLSIAVTFAIVVTVVLGSARFFLDPHVSVTYFLTGDEWSAGFEGARYGILPLVGGTVVVAAVAAAVALPLGLMTAIYLGEYAQPGVRRVVKPALEMLAGIPTVVYGYFALTTITPFLAYLVPGLNEPTNQLAGGIVVGIMILPMVASLSEDAIRAVPRSLREASYALGANQYETSTRVVVPAALSGILASFILALSRAAGETMAVSLACGDKPELTLDPRRGFATMTSFIVRIAQGDVQHGSTDYNSLFAVAGTLFVLTLSMNVVAQWILARYRQVYQ
jgi:phosphate transport system permease protein